MYILNDLWYGNVPFSERGLHRGSPGHKALHEATEAESNLLKLLNEEQKELLKVYDDAYSKMLGICECVRAFPSAFVWEYGSCWTLSTTKTPNLSRSATEFV